MKAGIGICYFTNNPLKDFYMGTAQLNGFKFLCFANVTASACRRYEVRKIRVVSRETTPLFPRFEIIPAGKG